MTINRYVGLIQKSLHYHFFMWKIIILASIFSRTAEDIIIFLNCFSYSFLFHEVNIFTCKLFYSFTLKPVSLSSKKGCFYRQRDELSTSVHQISIAPKDFLWAASSLTFSPYFFRAALMQTRIASEKFPSFCTAIAISRNGCWKHSLAEGLKYQRVRETPLEIKIFRVNVHQ